MKFIKIKRLASRGHIHLFLPLLVIVLVAVVGTYVLVASHADSKAHVSSYYLYSDGGRYPYVQISASAGFSTARCGKHLITNGKWLAVPTPGKSTQFGALTVNCITPAKSGDAYLVAFDTAKPTGPPTAQQQVFILQGVDSCVFVHAPDAPNPQGLITYIAPGITHILGRNADGSCNKSVPLTLTPATTPAPAKPTPTPAPVTKPQPTPRPVTKKPASPKAYINPFKAVIANGSLVPFRIDEGVDYKGHGPVYAIGDGVVTVATTKSKFWGNEGGENTVYRLSSGRAKNLSVFVAESCTPKVHRTQKITAGQEVCYMHGDNSPWLETGWWNNKTGKPMAWSDYTPAGNPDGSETAYGLNFSQLLELLGVPGGNSLRAHVSTNQGHVVGKLPASWPRWTKN